MKKQVSKIIVATLLVILTFAVVDFELSWAEAEVIQEQNTVNAAMEVVEEEIEFLYIQSSELESPGTQNIAVAWEQDMTNIAEFTLVYSDGNNNAYEIKETNRAEKSVLFSKEFSSSEIGTYKIVSMKYLVEGSDEVQCLEFKDLDIKADFKVVNNQSDSIAATVDNNVTTTSTDVTELSGDVEALLETANVESTSDNGNVVIVIDPGHGGSQPGACSNGLKEKDITLKIAKYFRDELKEYSGVEVYMTRETDRDVSDGGDDELSKRVEFAAGKNADLLVSVHINSTGTGKAKGAEVWAPNKNYNFKAYEVGQAVAQDIQDELVKLGLVDRGVQTSYSKNNTKYPDGSLADYYAIIRESKEKGFPGIIVEHAFIDNASDAAFLKSEANLKKLGIADATGIANYFGLYKEKYIDISEGAYTINDTVNGVRLAIENGHLNNSVSVIAINGDTTIDSSQRFELVKLGNKEYKIMLEHSGKVLDVRNASSISNVPVQQYEWNGSNAQKWSLIDPEDGNNGYYIKSKLGTYLRLDENSRLVTTTVKSEATRWTFEASNSRPIADGVYGIANKTNSTMMLDVSGASMSNSGNVQVYSMNGTLAQKFDVRYAGNGYYRIVAMHSNKALDVASASTKVGANLWQYAANGTDAQLWKFIDAGNGYYYLKSKLGTIAAPVSNNMKNGTNVAMTALTGKENQKWMFEDLSRPISDGTYLILSGKDSLRAMTNKNGNAQINVYENIDGQKYDISYVVDGYYRIINKASGKVLEVAGGSKSATANLQEGDWNSADKQLWIIAYIGNGKYCLKSKLGTFVDVSSGSMAENNNIWMYSYNGTAAQIWKFDSSRTNQPIQPIKDGTYIFRSALKNSRVMDVSGGSVADYANVQLYSDNGTAAQKFIVTYIGNGYYNIINEKSKKSIDVANGSNKAGANLWQYTINGTDAQKWKFIDAGKGYYYIKSAKGTVIDVKSARTWNGTNIWMYSLNGTNAQKWKLEECKLTSIMGTTNVSSDDLAKYYNSKNKEYPYSDNEEAPNIKAFAQIYIEECEAEGVRVDVAFCQAMKETGWLQFNGDVEASQYNFAGIGETGNGVSGYSFDNIRVGIRAHIQHLKAYACEDKLTGECADPRFSYVQRGVSPYVEWLGQKENPWGKGWATAKDYGISIVKMIKEL